MSNPNCPNLKNSKTLARALSVFVEDSELSPMLARRFPIEVEQAQTALVEVFGTDWRDVLDAEKEAELFAKIDVTGCAEHFANTLAEAKRMGKWRGDNGLRTCLERLVAIGHKTGTKLYKDFANLSFTFEAGGLYGGCIFHTSDETWGIHT